MSAAGKLLLPSRPLAQDNFINLCVCKLFHWTGSRHVANNSSAPLCDQSVTPGEPLHVNLGKHRKKKETGFEVTTIEQSRQLANHCRRLHSEHHSELRGEKEEVEMLRSFLKVLDYVETNNIVTTCASSSRYGIHISI